MAKKNFYAVKKGRRPGIYRTWNDCERQVKGFPGALYQGFKTLKEAKDYLNEYNENKIDDDTSLNVMEAYVDGSFKDNPNRFSFGVVMLHNGKVRIEYGSSDDSEYIEMRNVAGEILGAIKAMEFAAEKKDEFDKLIIYYDYEGIEKWCTGVWKAKKEKTKEYVEIYKDYTKQIKIEFMKVKAHSGNKYNEVADSLAKFALDEDINSIVCGIEYDECYSHNLNSLQSLRELNISHEECIKYISETCTALDIKSSIQNLDAVDNSKHIVINVNKNLLSSKIQLHISKNGITINPTQGKNKELGLLIMKEFNNRFDIKKVETKNYIYKNLSEEKIQEVIDNLKLFEDDSNYIFTNKSQLSKNEKYCFEIKSPKTGEKITVHIYTNQTLQIQGKKYLLWEDVCYIIEKSINVKLDDIIGRISIGIDMKFKHDNIDYCDDILRNDFDISLVDSFMKSHDYNVILSVKCLFEHKINLTDFGILIDPLTKAFEGYFKTLIAHLNLESNMNLKRTNWKFDKLFNPDDGSLKEVFHNKLSNDTILKNRQLKILKEMCLIMWDLRNPINHSGPRGTLTINNYEDATDKFNNIMKLINDSYKLLVIDTNI